MSDLISRQEAIDAINRICPVDTEYDCTLFDRVDVRCVLSDLPSAQPERKTGRWIIQDKDNMFFTPHILKCPTCGSILDKHGVNAGRGDANYCPNCGSYNGGKDGDRK